MTGSVGMNRESAAFWSRRSVIKVVREVSGVQEGIICISP